MLWPRKSRDPIALPQRDAIVAAELAVQLDDGLFERHFQTLDEAARHHGGIEALLEALAGKQRLFAVALERESLPQFDAEAAQILLETVFSARRKLFPALAGCGSVLPVLLDELLYGGPPLAGRMQRFVDALPIVPGRDAASRKAADKLRRAARDFAAECLHFRDPLKYPLMARWVWDAGSMSGALREFVAGMAQQAKVPLDERPETYEAGRSWLAQRIEAKGIYRDVPLWIDLLLAAGYSHYFRAMTGGTLGGDFTRGLEPGEEIRKLLGIESARPGGKSRVIKAVTGEQ